MCAIAAALPDGTTEVVREQWRGSSAIRSPGENGFGYDPIFFLPEYGCTSAELSPEEKNELSHRGEGPAEDARNPGEEEGTVKVLIVSDTHKSHRNLERIIEKEKPFQMLIHLGDVEGAEDYIEALADCPVHIVRGK